MSARLPVVLIPAYEPDRRLLELVTALLRDAPLLEVVIVDDGSGPAYDGFFERARHLGCTVLQHPANRGKGAALRTGFAHIAGDHPGRSVVCADCDGQHRPADILRVAEHLDRHPAAAMALGTRAFTGPVPARSRIGNHLTRVAFLMATGSSLRDTQTGLRAYPSRLLDWLGTVAGERFEYELEVLLQARKAGMVIEQVEIATIYQEGNSSSHFRPVFDSLRVYAPLVRFSASSLGAFVLDTLGVVVITAASGSLLTAVVGARLISASVNFATNRRLVFHRSGSARPGLSGSALRYGSLAAVLLLLNYALMHLLVLGLAVPLAPAKLITEVSLFGVGFHVQRRFVFAPARRGGPMTPGGEEHEEPSPLANRTPVRVA